MKFRVKLRLRLGLKSRVKSLKALVRRSIKLVQRARKSLAEAGGRRIVTLDLDSTTIRMLEIKGKRVRKWGSIALKQGDGEGGITTEQVSSSVKELMSSCGVKARKVMVSISGLYSVNRILALAAGTGRPPVQQSVLEAMRETVSLNMDELYTSWGTLGFSGGMRNIFAVSMPRDIIDVQMPALKAAGIRPQTLELRAMALIRAVPTPKAMILNVDTASFDLIIVAGGIPAIVRTLAWQRDDMDGGERSAYLASLLEPTVDFYNSHHPDDPVSPATPLFLTGQMSEEPALLEGLRERLAYPTEKLAPPLDFPAGFPISQYAANIGLTLRSKPGRGARKNEHLPLDIDLLPEAYRPWRLTIKQIGFGLGIVGCIAVVALLYQASSDISVRTAALEQKYSILDSELQRRQLELKNRVPLQKTIDEFNMILAKGGNFTADLEAIYKKADEVGVEVKSIAHEGKTIDVTIQASDYILFRQYAMALENTGRFSGFVLPPEGYPFTTSGTIKFQPKTPSSTPTPTPIPTPAPTPKK